MFSSIFSASFLRISLCTLISRHTSRNALSAMPMSGTASDMRSRAISAARLASRNEKSPSRATVISVCLIPASAPGPSPPRQQHVGQEVQLVLTQELGRVQHHEDRIGVRQVPLGALCPDGVPTEAGWKVCPTVGGATAGR